MIAEFTCPRCGMASYNPADVAEGYCGNCHDWTQEHRLVEVTEWDSVPPRLRPIGWRHP